MALIACKECKSEVSNTAKTCPKCGAKMPAQTGTAAKFAVVMLVLGVVMAIINKSNTPDAPAKTPAEIAEATRQEAEFQSVVQKLKALKASAKNPASFELESAILMANGALCVKYRATNSFNAVVPEQKVITAKAAFGDWGKDCSGKTGIDYKKARHAL